MIAELSFIPLFVGNKTHTSKFGEYEGARWEITARLVRTN